MWRRRQICNAVSGEKQDFKQILCIKSLPQTPRGSASASLCPLRGASREGV